MDRLCLFLVEETKDCKLLFGKGGAGMNELMHQVTLGMQINQDV
jgi:hypothetical protein